MSMLKRFAMRRSSTAAGMALARRWMSAASARDAPALSGQAGKYARALYNLAKKENATEQVRSELQQLVVDFQSDKTQLLTGSAFPKKVVGDSLVAWSGSDEAQQFNDVTVGLINALGTNQHQQELFKVQQFFDELVAYEQGEVRGVIISADPLSPAQMKRAEKALSTHINKGEKLILENKVNPDIVGGVQVQLAGQFADLSVEKQINTLTQEFKDFDWDSASKQ
eukprot:TRINITY_DN34007_c0_g1_i1.p3 TRINITY_DN34007_c0_g1~~TRINITY_DN34007_c0_g1_i1.p3  ORF type:complete len:236 (-),score=126.86 TRINITY_DN34007_c0_g1_i1:59-733(-)